MKKIETLVDDIYGLFGSGIEFDKEIAKKFGEVMAESVAAKVPAVHTGGTLRGSNLGKPCFREKWYTVNEHDKHEGFDVATKLKFAYGHVVEELILYLAAEAGHTVEGMQDELRIGSSVLGHRDAVIDGVLVDVKSCAPYTFAKFATHLRPEDDGFGYIAQLQSYLWASQDDPLVTDKDRAAFLAVCKTSGKLCLDFHQKDGKNWGEIADGMHRIVTDTSDIPPRQFPDEADGASGNRKLGFQCGYCGFKNHCWPGLRTFLYSGKPRFLTRVEREPNVPEATTKTT